MKILAKIVLSLFFILFSLGQFQRIQLENNINFYLHDLVVFFWINYSFFSTQNKIYKLSLFYKKLNQFKFEILFIFIIIIGLIFGVKNSSELIKPVLYIIRIVSYILFSLSLSKEIISYNAKFSLKYCYLVTVFFILLWGLMQYFLIPDVRFLSILGWDDHYYRLVSTQFDPAFAGILFVIGVGYLLSILELFKKNKLFFYLFHFGLMYGILLTFSRASYISYISLLFLNILLIKNSIIEKKLLFMTVIIFSFSILFVPKKAGEGNNLLRTSTINSRISSTKNYSFFEQKYQWLIGRGIFIYKAPKNQSNAQFPDNIFVTLFTGTGVIGCIVFLYLFLKWGKKLYKTNTQLFILTIAILIHSQFNNTFLQPFVLLMWLGGIYSIKKSNT